MTTSTPEEIAKRRLQEASDLPIGDDEIVVTREDDTVTARAKLQRVDPDTEGLVSWAQALDERAQNTTGAASMRARRAAFEIRQRARSRKKTDQ